MNITVIESGKVHKDGSVQGNGRQYAFDPGDGRNLLHCLRELGISVPNDCGGNGRCGKCKVFFPEGAPEATEGDLEKLSTEELDLGYRLACMHAPGEDMVIVIPESGEDAMEILGTQVHTTDAGKPGMTELVASADMGIIRGEETEDLQGDKCPDDNYRFAIDLGTTTVVVALLKGTEAIGTEACVNHQRRFGADVISRIQASMEGKGEALREIILDDLMGAMEKLKERLHLSENCIRQVIIAGNT
ncbi:MAG: 2Fe-2S iron-sulfur cluster binding domain-containing protein, partial [Lachnospiraceae bacterium]|nr:2Fe-2S iron-sulfur cluster binding domain-containing protein [Lachnospiraceae bacterium]